MIEMDDIIDGIKADYQWYEQNRLNENTLEIDHRLQIQQIFNQCEKAIEDWVSRQRYPFADRYRILLYLRYRKGLTLKSIGQKLDLSKERVRQIELKLLKIIRDYFRKTCPEEFVSQKTAYPYTARTTPVRKHHTCNHFSPSEELNPNWKGAIA